jgi:sirohydrochlorin cobaltochelatase
MIGYLLFSHGSLLCGSGNALEQHAMRMRAKLAPAPVEIGYLNYTEPDVSEAVKNLLNLGVSKIIVVPFFLVPGYFVSTSLPKRLAEITPNYPGLSVEIAEPLGVDSRIADSVIEAVHTARTPNLESDEVYQSAAAACRLIETCPFYGGPHCVRFMGKERQVFTPPTSSRLFSETELAKTGLLVMIHGSPNESANQPMLDILEIVRAKNIFAYIQPGFMECNEPSIPDAIDLVASHGEVKRIIAVPYFLHLGTHVSDDLPSQLIAGQEKHPEIDVLITDYIGKSARLSEVLVDRANGCNSSSI